MANPLLTKSQLAILRGDAAAALTAAEALEAWREHRTALYRTYAELLPVGRGAVSHDPATGTAQLPQGLAALADHGKRLDAPFYSALLAQLEAETLDAERALARIDEALALAHQIEQRCNLAFMYRLRGEILLKRDPPDPAPAEEAFSDRRRRCEGARRAQPVCARRCRSRSSTNRPPAPSTLTPSSRLRSKAFRRRPKCRRSPRRRRCWWLSRPARM